MADLAWRSTKHEDGSRAMQHSRFFLLAKISGVKRSVRRMPRRNLLKQMKTGNIAMISLNGYLGYSRLGVAKCETRRRQPVLLSVDFFLPWQKCSGVQRSGRRMPSIAYTLCSNQPTCLPKFANLNFLEDTTPSATLKNVILRF